MRRLFFCLGEGAGGNGLTKFPFWGEILTQPGYSVRLDARQLVKRLYQSEA